MEELIRLQSDVRSQISRGLVNFKKSPKERLSEAYCQTRLENLEQKWESFINNHAAIVRQADSDNELYKLYADEDIYENTEDTYIEFKSVLRFALSKLCPPVSSESGKSVNVTASNGNSNAVKLPKICIPQFSGKYSEWQTFKDMFTSLIHGNDSLGNVEKLHYLKGYVTGEAEQLIRQIPVSADNYVHAWTLLNERFNNKKYMSNCIIKRLLSQRNLSNEVSSGLKDLIDTTTDCLDGLRNLNIDVSNWDILVIHILSLKLDPETKKQWELHVSSNVSSDCLPTYEQFKCFITQRYRALEFIEPNKYHKNVNVDNNQGKLKTFHVLKQNCVYCDQEHKINYCSQFMKQSVDDRRDFVRQKRLCFNCLRLGHLARDCKNNTRCKICRRLHNTLLHLAGSSSSSSASSETKNKITERSGRSGEDREQGSSAAVVDCTLTEQAVGGEGNITSCFLAETGKQVLLATAVVKVEANNGKRQSVRALLDQGSQASFVTESTVQLLGLKKSRAKNVISGLGGNKKVITNSTVVINLHSRVDPKIKLSVKAYVLSKITSFLPIKKVVDLKELDLTGIILADPEYHTPNKIDMLLGADVYGQVLQDGFRKSIPGGVIAQATSLGWIISGTVTDLKKQSNSMVVMHSLVEDNETLKKRVWKLESEQKKRNERWMYQEEMKCEELYRNKVKKTGR
ncbi:uncharacterized protein LOC114364858 [Ostrinia furnacalis]|uniref:uncharacterized protein LOC114364858 n=1 Tax=Ostrinia furnacalis TaxID=93504 RepID=UPI00103D6FBA|nr:uncharacterized protein LOC114364858 [Ostrinia furnacalis]